MVHVLSMICSGLLVTADPGPRAAVDTLSSEARAAYEALRSWAGKDPDAQVRLALWCEAHGMTDERRRNLEQAVAGAPGNVLARGLLGQVDVRGDWLRPDEVGVKAGAVPALAEYNARRQQMPETAEAHWKMALWCAQKNLEAEERAHLAVVVQLDPHREAAWRRLGCTKHNGRWLTDALVAEEKAERDRQEQANRHWKPLLEKYREALTHKDRSNAARQALAAITEPRAVPMVWHVFALGDAGRQAVAVQVLGQLDSPASSKALAMLAAFGIAPEVRKTATESLKKRDPREFAGMLIALLRDPIKYEVRPVGGPGAPGGVFVKGQRFNVLSLYSPAPLPFIPSYPGDTIGYDANGLPTLFRQPQTITVARTGRIAADRLSAQINVVDQQAQAKQAQIQQLAQAVRSQNALALQQAAARLTTPTPAMPGAGPLSLGNFLSYSDPNTHLLGQQIANIHQKGKVPLRSFGFGLDANFTTQTQIPIGQMVLQAQMEALSAEAQLESEVATIESFNAIVNPRDLRFAQVLSDATGQNLGTDREAWKTWWVDQLGYAYKPKDKKDVPTVVVNVPLEYQASPVVPVTSVTGTSVGFHRMSCFGAGTVVRTYSGTQAIETLRVGDLVLTQNLKTGALGYQPILVVYHNPPSKTFEIELGGETIVSSYFHRFWKPGQGWVMARDLIPGDTLRVLGGLVRVAAIREGSVQPVFNLDVAQDADFFVGRSGTLVHDNTLPNTRLAPFDAPSRIALALRAPEAHIPHSTCRLMGSSARVRPRFHDLDFLRRWIPRVPISEVSRGRTTQIDCRHTDAASFPRPLGLAGVDRGDRRPRGGALLQRRSADGMVHSQQCARHRQGDEGCRRHDPLRHRRP